MPGVTAWDEALTVCLLVKDGGLLLEGALRGDGQNWASWIVEHIRKDISRIWLDAVICGWYLGGQWADFKPDLRPKVGFRECGGIGDVDELWVLLVHGGRDAEPAVVEDPVQIWTEFPGNELASELVCVFVEFVLLGLRKALLFESRCEPEQLPIQHEVNIL
jgi:hypothetical protein